jgi:phytol kinase
MDRLLSFFHDNFPSGSAILIGGPLGLVVSLAFLVLAGWLKRDRKWKTGYTRKVFHFLTFITVAACLATPGWGMPIVCLFGGMSSLVILFALMFHRSSRLANLMYEAMAREKDEPHRTAYIVTPYFATLLGGLAGSILFGPAAIAGFLVTGVADAVAEPVGTRFGKHPYRVITATKTKSYRSYEGSAAVFVASLLCVLAAAAMSPALGWSPRLWWAAPMMALCCVVVEGVSPHGWDNFSMQVVPAGLAAWWIAV